MIARKYSTREKSKLKHHNRLRIFMKIAFRLCELADQRMYSGWKQSKWLRGALGEELKFVNYRKTFVECVQKVIDERRDSNINCLLDVLLADEELSQTEIVSTVIGFIVLGYDRLSSSTCLALADLASRSEIQKIVREEIKQNESKKSPLLESLILESQRLRPAVPLIAKWMTVGVPLVGFYIPPESSVFLYLSGTSRDANQYPKPDNFDINRTNLSEQRNEKSLSTTITKAVVESLVTKYRLKVDNENVEVGSGITARPIRCKIRFESQ